MRKKSPSKSPSKRLIIIKICHSITLRKFTWVLSPVPFEFSQHSLLICRKKRLSSLFIQIRSSIVHRKTEMFLPKDPVIEKMQNKHVAKRCPERFQQIQSQGREPNPLQNEENRSGIQTMRPDARFDLPENNRIRP